MEETYRPKNSNSGKRQSSSMAEEDGIGTSGHYNQKLHYSSHSVGMESSIFRFSNVNFVVGAKDKQKHILRDVSGTCKWGRVLVVMGPSGAGKVRPIVSRSLTSFRVGCIYLRNLTSHDIVSVSRQH